MSTTTFNVKLEMDDGKTYTVSNKLVATIASVSDAFINIPFPASFTPGSSIKKVYVDMNAPTGTQVKLSDISVGRFVAGGITEDSYFYKSSKNIEYPFAYFKIQQSETGLSGSTILSQLELGIAGPVGSALKLKQVFAQSKSSSVLPNSAKTLYASQSAAGNATVIYAPNNDVTIGLADYTNVQSAPSITPHSIAPKSTLALALTAAGFNTTQIAQLITYYLQRRKDSFNQNNSSQVGVFEAAILGLSAKCDAEIDTPNRVDGVPIPGTNDTTPGKVFFPRPQP
jgi:hypothetical protein